MLGIKQSQDHVTNENFYQRVNQVPISEMIRERQLNFTGHCIRMHTDEPINRFFLYESKVNQLFDQERKQGHIDKKFRLTFYPAKKRSQQLKYGR